MALSDALLLVVAWCAYFVIHSVLASLRLKRWVAARRPHWLRSYRLAYNALAVVFLIVPLWLTVALDSATLWQWRGVGAWLANGLAGAAVLGFVWSLSYYDGAEFIGLRQWHRQMPSIEDQERLHISPLHRFVRHPWYSLGLLVIWTRDMNVSFLITAIAITLYFAIGSRLEERKLVIYHGDAYRDYQRRVPALVPRPWRYLTKEGVAHLLDKQQ